MDAGLVPVKRFDRAKQRLASHLSPPQRAEIARALWEDALALCLSAPVFEWWIVTDDEDVLEEAKAAGLETVRDPGGGLNRALSEAVRNLVSAGADSVSVVPSDVPLAYAGDLQDLLDTGSTSDVVVVPSGEGGGTNGLYLSPPGLIEPRFGPGSLQSHIAEAERLKARCSILELPRMSLDLDTMEDIEAYLAQPKFAPSKTVEALARLSSVAWP